VLDLDRAPLYLSLSLSFLDGAALRVCLFFYCGAEYKAEVLSIVVDCRIANKVQPDDKVPKVPQDLFAAIHPPVRLDPGASRP
jgi:hypothetical protein